MTNHWVTAREARLNVTEEELYLILVYCDMTKVMWGCALLYTKSKNNNIGLKVGGVDN